ncbi:O-antigen ligase family protein [Thaumasiovibrio sp. DFM-14]|uniref:O-antigen ligase family protein n=1 Tax=Thaumasiovibrio sp. DFM-14 TaxID=3384792 RepID=UPI0039A38583
MNKVVMYLPLAWMLVMMTTKGQADKPLVAIVLVTILTVFFSEHRKGIVQRCDAPWVKMLFMSALFGTISYWAHGYSSQELRATMIALLFCVGIPFGLYSMRVMQYFLTSGALVSLCVGLMTWNGEEFVRKLWPVNPIIAGTLIGITCVLGGAFLITAKDNRYRTLNVLTIAISLAALMLTQSRGPILAVLPVISVQLWVAFTRHTLNKKYLCTTILVLLCGVVLTLPVMTDRIQRTIHEVATIHESHSKNNISLRTDMYKLGLHMIKARPLEGYGYTYRDSAVLNNLPSEVVPEHIIVHFHNMFIDKWVVSGILGFVIMMFFYIYPLKLAWRVRGDFFWLLVSPVAYIILASLTDVPLRNGATCVTYLCLMGIIVAKAKESEIE